MKLSKVFNFANKQLRTTGTPDEPWFCGKDFANILRYSDPLSALRDIIKDKNKAPYSKIIDKIRIGETPALKYNEANLYAFIKYN